MGDTGTTEWTENQGSRHLVLVVDDDARIRAYVKGILQGSDVQVLEAGDGLEALDVFRAWGPKIELVITDIGMPRMTGSDLARLLRVDSPAIPLIFVSGEPAPNSLCDLQKGFVFIEKPFAPNALLDAARHFLN